MAHQAEVVEIRELSGGTIAIRACCGGDATTDSVHTLFRLDQLSEAQINEEITQDKANVEAKHESRQRARAIVEIQMKKAKA